MTSASPPGYDVGDEHNTSSSVTPVSVPSNPAGIPLPMSPPPQEPQHAALDPFDDPAHATTTSPQSSTAEATYAPPSGPPPTAQNSEPTQQRQGTPQLPQRPQENHDDEFADPRIATLHAMFPDFDAEFLQNVLDSVGGDQDRAVDALLGMTDPDYVPTERPQEPETARPRSQTELDEDFARQLMLEEEDMHRREQMRQQSRAQHGQTDPYGWAPQTGSRQQQQSPNQGAPGMQRDTMTDVQEQFNKIAESGKRTFTSIVSKVKAKVQEFDQSRNNGQGSSQTGTQPSWGAPSGGAPSGLDRHSQQAYYASNNAPYESRRSTSNDVNTYSNVPPSTHSSSMPTPASPPMNAQPAPAHNVTGYNLVDTGSTPPPPTTNSGNIDTGRIGLLPKRPVSLVGRDAPQPVERSASRDDESEELEYMENPFEESSNVRR